MATVDNCSDTIPFSDVYFADLHVGEKVGIGISTGACLTIIALFVVQAYHIIKKHQAGGDPEIKVKSLWLLGIYPIFASAALLALYVPRASLLSDLASSVYLAMCLFHFTSLIILYFGGIPQLLHNVQDTGFRLRTGPCCCCCFCCPDLNATKQSLTKLRVMVFQTSLLQPFISFVTLVLWLNDEYTKGSLKPDHPSLYLSIMNTASTLIAMYGLIVLFRSTRQHLTMHNITPKFVVLQLVLIFHNLQGFVFLLLVKNSVIKCRGRLPANVRSDAIQHMVLIGEMFILFALARCLYRRPHNFGLWEQQNGLEQGSNEEPNSAAGETCKKEMYDGMVNVTRDNSDVFEAGNDNAAIVDD